MIVDIVKAVPQYDGVAQTKIQIMCRPTAKKDKMKFERIAEKHRTYLLVGLRSDGDADASYASMLVRSNGRRRDWTQSYRWILNVVIEHNAKLWK